MYILKLFGILTQNRLTEIQINDDGEKNLNIQSVADLNPQIQTEPNFQISENLKQGSRTPESTDENLKTLDDLVQLVKAAPVLGGRK